MDRLILFVVACTAHVGCQTTATNFDPFAFGRQTRVPPPPTNVIGNSSSFHPTRAPLPSVDASASSWHSSNYPARDRYRETAGDFRAAANADQRPTPQTESRRSSVAKDGEQARNDRLTWLDPDTKELPGPLSVYSKKTVESYPSQARRLFPRTGPFETLASRGYTRPLVAAPVRVRGFRTVGSQEVCIPAELAELQRDDRLRQTARWQPRYDDLRR